MTEQDIETKTFLPGCSRELLYDIQATLRLFCSLLVNKTWEDSYTSPPLQTEHVSRSQTDKFLLRDLRMIFNSLFPYNIIPFSWPQRLNKINMYVF